MLKQIVNVSRLKLFGNSERSREEIFLEDNFDIEKENEMKDMEIDKSEEQYVVDKIRTSRETIRA
jgi:hypothetical protein